MSIKRNLLWAFVLILLAACGIRQESKRPADSLKPNVVFILADDLSYRDLGIFGQDKFSTPHLDQLALNGMRFSQAYAGAPECAPSRGTLMTGLHTGHCSIRLNASVRGQEHLLNDDHTLAELFKSAGYKTAFIGKWGIGLPGTEGTPDKQGFDYSLGFYDQARAHTYFPLFLMENGQQIPLENNQGFDMPGIYQMSRFEDPPPDLLNQYDSKGILIPRGLGRVGAGTYSEAVFQQKALEFITENSENPFFLYYATQLPHGPVIVDSLGDLNHRTDFPLQKQKEWAAMVQRLDGFAGSLVQKLKDLHLYEHTMIIFSSDNGYSMCGYMGRGNQNNNWPNDPYLNNKGPFRGGKFSALEGGIRIPMFIHWQGQIDPIESDQPVWLLDLMPTFAELISVKLSQPLDGISLLPIIYGERDHFNKRPPMYWECTDEQAVRLDQWWAYRPHPDSLIQLFDKSNDVHTDRDMASENPEIVAKVKEIIMNEHVDHQWYHNPGETKQDNKRKREMAVAEGSLQQSTRPNGMK